jgi:VanZ family protein
VFTFACRLLLYFAHSFGKISVTGKKRLAYNYYFCSLYGVTDEFHQYFILIVIVSSGIGLLILGA